MSRLRKDPKRLEAALQDRGGASHPSHSYQDFFTVVMREAHRAK